MFQEELLRFSGKNQKVLQEYCESLDIILRAEPMQAVYPGTRLNEE